MRFFSDQLKIPALLFLRHPDFSFFPEVVHVGQQIQGPKRFSIAPELTMNNQRFPHFLRKTFCIMREEKTAKGNICFPT